jgi:hypothetical protein
MAGEEILQASVFFGDGVTFFCRGREHFFQSEDFLLKSFDVHLLTFTMCPAASQLPWYQLSLFPANTVEQKEPVTLTCNDLPLGVCHSSSGQTRVKSTGSPPKVQIEHVRLEYSIAVERPHAMRVTRYCERDGKRTFVPVC